MIKTYYFSSSTIMNHIFKIVNKKLQSWEKQNTTSIKLQNKEVNLKSINDLKFELSSFQPQHQSCFIFVCNLI